MHSSPQDEPVHEVEISDVSYGGDGVARLDDGMAVFIPLTAVGDRVRIRITERQKRFARGEVVELLSPGPGRTEPSCQYFGRCGGCAYQHLDADVERDLKINQLKALLTRIGKFEALPEISTIVRSPQAMGYRNRISLQPIRIDADRVHYGYVERDGKTPLNVKECPLAHPKISGFITRLASMKWARKNATRPRPKGATIRVDSRGERYAWFGHAPASIPWPHEVLDDDSVVNVPLDSFTQVNPEVGKALLSWLRSRTTEIPTTSFVDAYCGSGVFALVAAPQVQHAYGLELDATAIAAARVNAGNLKLDNCVWIDGDVGENLAAALDAAQAAGTTRLLLDPPRAGCRQEVIDAVLKLPPDEIVMISCNASTLARDLSKLRDAYELVDLAFFDMFPRTAHFETAAVLKRKS